MPKFPRCLIACLACAVLLAGCAEEPPEVDIYRVRGVVMGLPEAGNPTSALMVHHEAIPTFIGHDGVTTPMPEMTMAFPTASGVAIDRLEVGDKVQIRLEVTRGRGFQATEVTSLANDLELNLGAPDAMDDHAGHDHAGHDHATH